MIFKNLISALYKAFFQLFVIFHMKKEVLFFSTSNQSLVIFEYIFGDPHP